jgi:hypothetical protein
MIQVLKAVQRLESKPMHEHFIPTKNMISMEEAGLMYNKLYDDCLAEGLPLTKINRIPIMVPLTASLFGSFFKGAYLPQKLAQKTSIETRYNLFQRRVLFYILKISEGCFVWVAPPAISRPYLIILP